MFGIFADVMNAATLRPNSDLAVKPDSKKAREHFRRLEAEEQKARRQFYQQKW